MNMWPVEELLSLLRGRRVGLISGPAGWIDGCGYLSEVLRERANLVALFAPEHGFWGELQAGVPVPTYRDERLGCPVYSLYGKHKVPPPEVLAEVDVLVFHLQDVTCRNYTYKTTLEHTLRAAVAAGVSFILLDRPTPLNGVTVQGNVAPSVFFSQPLPLRYGLTLGELALLLKGEDRLEVDLTVLPVKGWRREQWYDETGLLWIAPSPNLPTLTAATLFPATVILEGTNFSVGRGTTRPFELIGAPWCDGFRLATELNRRHLPGVLFRPCYFQPTFDKYAGEVCSGVQLHLTDRETFDGPRVGLHLLDALRRLHPTTFEMHSTRLDACLGTDEIRRRWEAGEPPEVIADSWGEEQRAFEELREKYRLYA